MWGVFLSDGFSRRFALCRDRLYTELAYRTIKYSKPIIEKLCFTTSVTMRTKITTLSETSKRKIQIMGFNPFRSMTYEIIENKPIIIDKCATLFA